MFETKNPDGRSQVTILVDHVKAAEPGTLFSYDELTKILETTADKARSIVISSQRRLLKQHQRTLVNVRGKGYKMARADEHVGIAHGKKRRADNMLRRGVETLENVRAEELTTEQRKMHEGNLMVFQGILMNQKNHEQRLRRIENAIADALTSK